MRCDTLVRPGPVRYIRQVARNGAQMTKPGAEPSLPCGVPVEPLLEDFLNPSRGAGARSGTVAPVPGRRASGRADIRVEA